MSHAQVMPQCGVCGECLGGVTRTASGCEVVESLHQMGHSKEAVASIPGRRRPTGHDHFHDGAVATTRPLMMELCAVCHNPVNAFSTSLEVERGAQLGYNLPGKRGQNMGSVVSTATHVELPVVCFLPDVVREQRYHEDAFFFTAQSAMAGVGQN